ncbi:hypothetical protein E2C01_013429 [Portunus trituberculatus]|uniref:Uncharacterized protein n=1 Tax=Portunus trituberculatus TaxID=210409 RepID=A0A5B7DH08_PORTR|nr:hypothetical protein [Portunus trituberculatus]
MLAVCSISDEESASPTHPAMQCSRRIKDDVSCTRRVRQAAVVHRRAAHLASAATRGSGAEFAPATVVPLPSLLTLVTIK